MKKNRLLGIFIYLSVLVMLMPNTVLAASDVPDIGCYEYGSSDKNTSSNLYPVYQSDNFGGSGKDYYVSTVGNVYIMLFFS